MIIKVCGMREADNIRAVEQLGIDWIGLVFCPSSPRYVQHVSSRAGIIPDYSSLSEDVISASPAKRVGVFVDDMPQNIVTAVVNYHLDIVQLHGSESPVMIDNLRRTIDPDIHQGIKVMKAIALSTVDDLALCNDYEKVVDYFLFDTKGKNAGGNGVSFDWKILKSYKGKVPFLLSGGIGPDDAAKVKAFSHPQFMGIDLNSRFEKAPGEKDVILLEQFVQQVRKN